MKEKISWADAFILIYAVNDAVSFKEIARLKFLVYHVLTNSHIKVHVYYTHFDVTTLHLFIYLFINFMIV